MNEPLGNLRQIWEETSYQLELLQTDSECAEQQKYYLEEAEEIIFQANFDFSIPMSNFLKSSIRGMLQS